jgi:hypothetical protein
MLVLVCLQIVLILKQDMCTVCAERTAGSKIILENPIEHLGDVRHVESYFGPFGDIVSIGSCYAQGLRQM